MILNHSDRISSPGNKPSYKSPSRVIKELCTARFKNFSKTQKKTTLKKSIMTILKQLRKDMEELKYVNIGIQIKSVGLRGSRIGVA